MFVTEFVIYQDAEFLHPSGLVKVKIVMFVTEFVINQDAEFLHPSFV